LSVEDWLERDTRRTYDGRYVLKSREEDGVCIHLNDRQQCTVYEVRPAQCRAFPWWGENLATLSAWKSVKSTCPGIDAEDALLIDGQTIRLNIFADRTSTKGFRTWPPSDYRLKR
jgi:Fe-S-cluster containining protein